MQKQVTVHARRSKKPSLPARMRRHPAHKVEIRRVGDALKAMAHYPPDDELDTSGPDARFFKGSNMHSDAAGYCAECMAPRAPMAEPASTDYDGDEPV